MGVSVSSNRIIAMFTQQKQCETTAGRGTISGMHGDDESEDIADMGNPVEVHTMIPMGIPHGGSFWVPAWDRTMGTPVGSYTAAHPLGKIKSNI